MLVARDSYVSFDPLDLCRPALSFKAANDIAGGLGRALARRCTRVPCSGDRAGRVGVENQMWGSALPEPREGFFNLELTQIIPLFPDIRERFPWMGLG